MYNTKQYRHIDYRTMLIIGIHNNTIVFAKIGIFINGSIELTHEILRLEMERVTGKNMIFFIFMKVKCDWMSKHKFVMKCPTHINHR